MEESEGPRLFQERIDSLIPRRRRSAVRGRSAPAIPQECPVGSRRAVRDHEAHHEDGLIYRNPVSPAPRPPRRSSDMTPPNIEAVRKALKFAEVERRENCETPHSVRSMTEWYHLPAIIVNRWYEGPVPCEFCHCTMHLLIGGWNRSGNKRTEPFEGSNGGKLLEPATLVVVRGANRKFLRGEVRW